ncbi:TPA: diphthine synthase [Candidatus Woesearchaeota archaeon]|nr:diphthine synthase [Candidatus Woesearchaeota archaeon]
MLTLIGLGLRDGNDITLRGLDAVKRAAAVYIEGYTSLLQCSHQTLEAQLGRDVVKLTRDDVETGIDAVLTRAKTEDIAILVVGDVFGATTHTDLYLRAAQAGVHIEVVHNASVMNAIGIVGLELYRYGKTVSVPYWSPGFEPTSYLDGIRDNKALGLHTLCLLDIKADEGRFMSVSEGLALLLAAEERKRYGALAHDALVIGVARIGCADMIIQPGPLSDVANMDFGAPPHCIIIPGRLHQVEEDMLAHWMKTK